MKNLFSNLLCVEFLVNIVVTLSAYKTKLQATTQPLISQGTTAE